MAVSSSKESITLVGAGLAGSLLAIFLARRGFRVEVYERRPDMRQREISAGRSINLALSVRGIHALRQVGLASDLLPLTIPMRGRMMHSLTGELSFQRYGRDDNEVIHSVSRGELNKRLMTAAEQHGNVRIHFNQRCLRLHLRKDELVLRDEISGARQTLAVGRVIGTDGSASEVRSSILRGGRYDFSQHYLEYGYKELTMPPGPNGIFRMDKHALHIWPRGNYMLIALPNLDASFTCTLFLPFEGENSFAQLHSPEKVTTFFEQQFPDAVPHLSNLREEFFANPTGAMVTIKCFPWRHEDKCLLLGDAAHAIVPFFGQGMNCAFEDCTVLDDCLAQHLPDWERVLTTFEIQRKENTDAIADMALENFIEMRDRTADPRFLLQKRVELALAGRFPKQFVPKYSMVSFQRVPYAEAIRTGRVQERILNELCADLDSVDDLDWARAEKMIRTELS